MCLAAGVFAAFAATGCGTGGDGVATLEVSELAALLKTDPTVRVYDANNASTREKYGVIPGAILLSDYAEYDVSSELPADKDRRLVFYCGSTKCSAAPKAAHRAVEAGYRDVRVLPEGIKGWVAAGLPVDGSSAG